MLRRKFVDDSASLLFAGFSKEVVETAVRHPEEKRNPEASRMVTMYRFMGLAYAGDEKIVMDCCFMICTEPGVGSCLSSICEW